MCFKEGFHVGAEEAVAVRGAEAYVDESVALRGADSLVALETQT